MSSLNSRVVDLQKRYDSAVTKKKLISNQLQLSIDKAKGLKRSLRQHEQALVIVREVGLKTQQQFQYHINDITSLALEAVFKDQAPKLQVEFVERRNKLECDLWLVEEDKKMDPLAAKGGGIVDIAAFALRIASWSMIRPRLRPTLILDEPLRWLSKEYQVPASRMLKELSDRLGVQFLIITHEATLTSYADRVFEVKKGRNKISKVVQL